jgi:signal peptidase
MGRSKSKLIANIIGIVLCVILLPVVIINLTLVVRTYQDRDSVPTMFGMGMLIVETGSMRAPRPDRETGEIERPDWNPEWENGIFDVRENDLLIMREVDFSALRRGDVIAYYDHRGIVVTHRIIGFDTDDNGARLYITQGDFNNVQDANPVAESRVAGLIVNNIPRGGHVVRFLGQPLVTVVVIGVPLALLFGWDALRKALAKRKEKEAIWKTDEPQTTEDPGEPN